MLNRLNRYTANFVLSEGVTMIYESIRHECGARAHIVGQLCAGWNVYLCSRCGETFHKWITSQMFDAANGVR